GPVGGPLARGVDVGGEEAGAAGLAEEGDVEDVEVLGEGRDDVESHRSPSEEGPALGRVRNGALRGERARLPRAAGPAPGTRRRIARCRAAAHVSRTRDGRRRGPGSLAGGGFKRGRAARGAGRSRAAPRERPPRGRSPRRTGPASLRRARVSPGGPGRGAARR